MPHTTASFTPVICAAIFIILRAKDRAGAKSVVVGSSLSPLILLRDHLWPIRGWLVFHKGKMNRNFLEASRGLTEACLGLPLAGCGLSESGCNLIQVGCCLTEVCCPIPGGIYACTNACIDVQTYGYIFSF